jgi:hypothetical protein
LTRLVGHREPAQVYAWVAVALVLLLLPFVGLIADAGQLFLEQSALQRLADGAARTGAMGLDIAATRTSPGSCPRLDPRAAREAASSYLAREPGITSQIEVSPDAVGVEVQRPVRASILEFYGAGRRTLVARSVAHPRAGIQGARAECG